MTKIDISTSTLVRFILVLTGFWLLYILRDLLVLLFIVVILVAALSPTVDRWSRFLTRAGATVLVFLLIFAAATLIFSLLIPPAVEQLRNLSQNLPLYADQFSRTDTPGFIQSTISVIRDNINQLTNQLGNIGNLIFAKTLGVISGLVALLTILVLTFYLLLQEDGIKKIYRGILPSHLYHGFAETNRKVAIKLGAWLRGQLLLMILVGLFTTLGLAIIGSPYALTLGLWAGLTEAIPIIGPWLGAVPGVTVGFAENPLQGFMALLVYVVVQQLENAVLVPRIMSQAVGLNPVIVIITILIGAKLYGILGVIISVPIAATISVIVEDWPSIQKVLRSRPKNTAET